LSIPKLSRFQGSLHFNEFRTVDFQNLSDEKIIEKLTKYKLSVDDIKSEYSEPIKKIR